ncbi:MAG: hypothetical protein U1E89_04335 [Burkholderiaceae bacterium]
MKILFIVSAVLTVLLLAASIMYWGLHASTGEDAARQRAVGLFRWAVVVVLATFNIWIFARVFGAIVEIWFPQWLPKPPVVVQPADEAASEPSAGAEAAEAAASEPSK